MGQARRGATGRARALTGETATGGRARAAKRATARSPAASTRHGTATNRAAATKKTTVAGKATGAARADRDKRYWSGKVTRESHALDLEPGVFTWDDPKRIAASLRRSAERSPHRKAPPFRSAMSMLVFYINRAGPNLAVRQRRVLERAKDALRELYGKRLTSPGSSRTATGRRGPAPR